MGGNLKGRHRLEKRSQNKGMVETEKQKPNAGPAFFTLSFEILLPSKKAEGRKKGGWLTQRKKRSADGKNIFGGKKKSVERRKNKEERCSRRDIQRREGPICDLAIQKNNCEKIEKNWKARHDDWKIEKGEVFRLQWANLWRKQKKKKQRKRVCCYRTMENENAESPGERLQPSPTSDGTETGGGKRDTQPKKTRHRVFV